MCGAPYFWALDAEGRPASNPVIALAVTEGMVNRDSCLASKATTAPGDPRDRTEYQFRSEQASALQATPRA